VLISAGLRYTSKNLIQKYRELENPGRKDWATSFNNNKYGDGNT